MPYRDKAKAREYQREYKREYMRIRRASHPERDVTKRSYIPLDGGVTTRPHGFFPHTKSREELQGDRKERKMDTNEYEALRDHIRWQGEELREAITELKGPIQSLEARITAIETALRMSARMALEHLPVPAPGHHLLTDVDPVPYDALHYKEGQ